MLTEEALLTADALLVLAVAAPISTGVSSAADVRVAGINPGTAVDLHQGTLHDACRGADGETRYYWLAACGLEESTWADIEGCP